MRKHGNSISLVELVCRSNCHLVKCSNLSVGTTTSTRTDLEQDSDHKEFCLEKLLGKERVD